MSHVGQCFCRSWKITTGKNILHSWAQLGQPSSILHHTNFALLKLGIITALPNRSLRNWSIKANLQCLIRSFHPKFDSINFCQSCNRVRSRAFCLKIIKAMERKANQLVTILIERNRPRVYLINQPNLLSLVSISLKDILQSAQDLAWNPLVGRK